jgi:predicted dithiol-disulfide oxidoreductase (DUF899 family)
MTQPNESPETQKLRAELLDAEVALKEQRERVAELRRKLPTTELAVDYVFEEGPRDLAAGDAPIRERSLAALFENPRQPLILMQFMFGGAQEVPCPMCTMWADGYDGAVPHLEQKVNFAIVVAGDLAGIREHARARGWRNVRIVSSQGTSFKRDFGFENEDGGQTPGVSVFALDADGRARHFYTGAAFMTQEHFRGMDLLSPVWNFLDLAPDGRGDFFPRLSYEE